MTRSRSTSAHPSDPGLPASYEQAVAELEQLVGQIDSGQLPLDELLTRYQRGAQLLAFCREKLQAIEQQIKVMDNGESRPWEAAP